MADIRNYSEKFSGEIRSYISLIFSDEVSNEDTLIQLSIVLSRLLVLGENCPSTFSESDTEPPGENRNEIERKLSQRFPDFGWYSSSIPLSKDKKPSDEVLMGDAIDDLADIHDDLREALWHIEHGDPEHGLWYAKLMFGHWGAHAIELKRYLHQRLHGF